MAEERTEGPEAELGRRLDERDVHIVVTVFPSGTRDFMLARRTAAGLLEAIHPLELLALDRTAKQIARLRQRQPPLALVLALCRLLVPCLRYRGVGRHLVVEPWSVADLRGQTIPSDVRTEFARQMSSAQAEEWQAVTTGLKPPHGSLAQLFWESQTELPALAPFFDDPEMGRMAKALYFLLVPEGRGMAKADVPAVVAQVNACRAADFAPLRLGISARKLQQTFKRLLAVAVRYASQMTGAVAEAIVLQRLRRTRRRLTAREKVLLELRYGACPALADINVGFLFGCGPLLADLVNDYFLTIACERPEADRVRAEELLRAFVFLLGEFQQRRKLARAQERREDRQRHADRMPHGPRHQAEFQEDTSVPAPEVNAAINEEMAQLETLLPHLKDRDAERLRAFIECWGDRKAAAERLGLDPKAYSQQLRQTVFPAIRRLAHDAGLDLSE